MQYSFTATTLISISYTTWMALNGLIYGSAGKKLLTHILTDSRSNNERSCLCYVSEVPHI